MGGSRQPQHNRTAEVVATSDILVYGTPEVKRAGQRVLIPQIVVAPEAGASGPLQAENSKLL